MKRRHQQRGGIISGLFKFVLFIGFVGIISLFIGYYFFNEKVNELGPNQEEKAILIKAGSGVSSIADQLVDDGVISSDLLFKILVRIEKKGTALQAGEFLIPQNATMKEVLEILVEGKPFLHQMTFHEGIITKHIIAKVNANELLTGVVEKEWGEGAFLPETYSFTRGENRNDVLNRMAQAQTSLIDSLWDNRAEGLPFTTKEEAIILASIVEKETGIGGERGLVASVFVNRLHKGIRLQSDPTTIYGLTGGEPLGRGLRESELRKATPYNTYTIPRLPITPIANPGKAAIEAVLNPTESDYIFFVADGTGGHAFATNLRDHNKNVAKWRKIERERKQ